ncbi:Zinc finger protein [Pyrenophora seminiperda CCB06]|uniref:Zinc finger protein n=1 Tax=Pyrenophora seminiperda CCB06 TaxID=1302712 RepID=A0A3M7M801_9PLEO|nr:Zinc finger protein [Pyrenophora seminiperda CCB06]
MTMEGNNRYALFNARDENAKPISKPAFDPSKNPFLNQVADDSIPWQEVKKRSAAPAVQQPPAHAVAPPLRMSKERTKTTVAGPFVVNDRTRGISMSTNDSADKVNDPHENWCGVCSVKFPNKNALILHMKQSPEHQHFCNLCKRIFKDRNGLKNHVDNSWDHEVHCNLCLSAFKNEWGLKNHFENNFTVGHEFVCLTCLLGFKTSAEMERHLQLAEKHTWCGTCQRRFRNQDERDEHWRKTNKPGCTFDGPDQAGLTEHLKHDHFQCEGCKRVLPSQTKLNQHYDSCSIAISCPRCGEHCAGKTQLALHLEHCYFCQQCGFHTHHEGNFQIHMTKHTSANIACWGCKVPMRTYSSLINHLESGRCNMLSEPALLMRLLGKWWYSPLYMDLDMHAHIRTGRVEIIEVQQWMNQGVLQPFICRYPGCGKVFGHLSSLVLHCESKACGWDVDRLNMPGLEKEFGQVCLRRDSATS